MATTITFLDNSDMLDIEKLIEQVRSEIPNDTAGSGLTRAQVDALNDMFQIVGYVEDPTEKYAAFRVAFGLDDQSGSTPDPDTPGGDSTHTHAYTSAITKAATCETAGARTYTCTCGTSYTEEIPATGHSFVDGACTVCGAKDPNFNEPSTPEEPAYHLSEPLVLDGQTTVDTGYNLFDRDKDWSICMTAQIDNGAGYAFSAKAGSEAAHYPAIGFRRSWAKYVPFCYGLGHESTGFEYNAGGVKVVLTRTAGAAQREFATMYFEKDGAVASYTCAANVGFTPIGDSTIVLGGCVKADGILDKMQGEISDFRVYERTLSESEMKAFLGVNA